MHSNILWELIISSNKCLYLVLCFQTLSLGEENDILRSICLGKWGLCFIAKQKAIIAACTFRYAISKHLKQIFDVFVFHWSIKLWSWMASLHNHEFCSGIFLEIQTTSLSCWWLTNCRSQVVTAMCEENNNIRECVSRADSISKHLLHFGSTSITPQINQPTRTTSRGVGGI